MKKEEAIQVMLKGNKVTHRYFADDEYMEMPYPRTHFLLSEQFVISPKAFWADRTAPGWDDGWEIYKGQTVDGPVIERRGLRTTNVRLNNKIL